MNHGRCVARCFGRLPLACSTLPADDCDLPFGVLVPSCTPPHSIMESDVLHDTFMHYPRLHHIFASPTASFQPADSFDAHGEGISEVMKSDVFGDPGLFQQGLCNLPTQSGPYIFPVTGEGNIYGFSGCLECFYNRRSTISFGRQIVRTEFEVFGSVPLILPFKRPADFDTDKFPSFASRSIQRKAVNSPLSQPRGQFQIEPWARHHVPRQRVNQRAGGRA